MDIENNGEIGDDKFFTNRMKLTEIYKKRIK